MTCGRAFQDISVCICTLPFVVCLQKMASSGSDQIQDSLSCSVCLERFNSSNHLPKFLPCQHTLCSSCIDCLLGSSLTLDGFDCPVCRSGVTSDEVRTNLIVTDIIEAVVAKENATLFCPTHPSKECQIVCADCCQLLCAMCTVNGEHMRHNVYDTDVAKGKMKKRLTTAIESRSKIWRRPLLLR